MAHTPKCQRRAARRHHRATCRAYGTARTARAAREGGEDAAVRIAAAMDLPGDMLARGGIVASARYWPPTGWLDMEPCGHPVPSWLRPRLALAAKEVTDAYLRPAMRAAGVEDDRFTVQVRLRPPELEVDAIPGSWLPYPRLVVLAPDIEAAFLERLGALAEAPGVPVDSGEGPEEGEGHPPCGVGDARPEEARGGDDEHPEGDGHGEGPVAGDAVPQD
jgi:hypothetical protein